MQYEVPPYVQIEHDAETRTATLSVVDKEQRDQREMWGESFGQCPPHECCDYLFF